jgi:maintenance of morphology protein 1
MGSGYVLSLHPTFTQGLILGQLSVLVLLALILRYLFLDSTVSPFETSSYHPGVDNDLPRRRRAFWHEAEGESARKLLESADWFSVLLKQVNNIHAVANVFKPTNVHPRSLIHIVPNCGIT